MQKYQNQFQGMLRRKKGDVSSLLVDIAKLFGATDQLKQRSGEEQLKLMRALDAVEDELRGVNSELSAATGPIRTLKNKTDFDDNIRLLTMELQTLGVSSNVVGDVQVLCCRHLANRSAFPPCDSQRLIACGTLIFAGCCRESEKAPSN